MEQTLPCAMKMLLAAAGLAILGAGAIGLLPDTAAPAMRPPPSATLPESRAPLPPVAAPRPAIPPSQAATTMRRLAGPPATAIYLFNDHPVIQPWTSVPRHT